MNQAIQCPRRPEDHNGVFNLPQSDGWRDDGTCTYCGSLSPDAFMSAVESGAEICPTDKDYKAYLDVPNPNVGKPRIVCTHSNPSADSVAIKKLDPSWKEVSPNCWEQTGTERAVMNAKFYFQHLSVEQRKRFVELLNLGKMKIGYPGHFYRMPFFITKPKSE